MKFILFFIFSLFFTSAFSQTDTAVLTLKKNLESTSNIAVKLDIVLKIAAKYNLENPAAAEDILKKGIFIAEESRDREMMIKARRMAGSFYTQYAGIREYAAKAFGYTGEALDLCKKEKGLEIEKTACNIQMAKLYRNTGDYTASKKYSEIATSIAEQTNNDSLMVVSKINYGFTQLVNGDKLEAFKTFITAQTIAEKSKFKNKNGLEVNVYNSLAEFYKRIEEYDKAIDYQYKTLNYFKKEKNFDNVLGVMFYIGENYISAKKFDAAKKIYEEQILLGDSLKRPDFKVNGFIGILNTLISGPDKDKAIGYLKTHPEVKAEFDKSNMGYQIDFGTAQAYTVLKKYDSAKYYFDKTLPILENQGNVSTLPNIYLSYSRFLYESGDNVMAIIYLKKSIAINDSLKNTINNKDFYEALDSCYQKTGDYKNAFFYNSLFQKAKAEADEKSKAKDILAVEIDTEKKRKERVEREEADATTARHNWQYMGIVLAILSLFILLALTGIFKIPLKWVRILGFISFIFLFEFIVLIADTGIHDFTHGEPWMVILIKVVLIAILLPLHHFLEEKVIHHIIKQHEKVAGNKLAPHAL